MITIYSNSNRSKRSAYVFDTRGLIRYELQSFDAVLEVWRIDYSASTAPHIPGHVLEQLAQHKEVNNGT